MEFKGRKISGQCKEAGSNVQADQNGAGCCLVRHTAPAPGRVPTDASGPPFGNAVVNSCFGLEVALHNT